MVGPNYKEPCVDAPDEFRFKIEKTKDTINTEWWEQFQDPVLVDLIDEALANNYDIKEASANVERAFGVYVQVRGELFPRIGYTLDAMKTLQSKELGIPMSPLTPNPLTSFDILINGAWELDVWGRISRLVQSAKANLFAAEEAHRGVIQNIVALTANTYLKLLGLDAQLDIAEETLESYAEMVVYFEKQYRYGQVSKINLAQALTQYEQANAAIPQIQIDIAQTEDALSILLGRNPGAIERGKTIYTIEYPAIPEGVPAELLKRRPDIVQSELEIMAANAQIGAAIGLYFPSISLTGYYGAASKDLKNLLTGGAVTWNFAAEVAGPLLTFGRISGQVKEWESETARAYYHYQNVVLNAFREVSDALVSHTLLSNKLEAEYHLIKASAEYEYLAMLQYREGYAPYFAVLQAQQQLFPAELSWVQTQVLLFTSLVNVYRAMGGGWIIIAEQKTMCAP